MTTVRQLLASAPALRQARVIAGASALDNEVRTVTILDAPDAYRWLRGGELVLSSGYFLKESPEVAIDFLSQLTQRNISCLALKTRRYVNELATELRDFAEQAELPVLELPPDVHWSEIIENFYQCLLEEEQAGKWTIDTAIYNRLIGELGSGLPNLLERIAQEAGVATAVFDPHGEILAASPKFPEDPQAYTWLRQQSGVVMPGQVYNGQHFLFVVPVPFAEQKEAASLVALSSRPIDNRARLIIELGAAICSTEIMLRSQTRRLLRELELEFWEKLLWKPADYAQLKELALDLNLLPDAWAGVALVETDNVCATLLTIQEALSHGDSRWLTRPNKPATNQILLLINFTAKDKKSAHAHVQKTLAKLNSRLSPTSRVAVGTPYSSLKEMRRSYQEARIALRLGKVILPYKTVVSYDELRFYVILDRCSYEELTDLIQPHLSKLIDSDKSDLELINTLEAYLRYPTVHEAAKSLFIHENTLRYRLQQLCKQLGNVDLNDFETRVQLWLELKAYQLLRAMHGGSDQDSR